VISSKLQRGEAIAIVGGLLLAVSVFVKWYEARPEIAAANIDGRTGTLSAWQVHDILRLLLLLAAVAPLILAWIIIREHQLSWPRGQLTMVASMLAGGLVFYNGIIDRPGFPSGQIELEIGWYGALLGTLLMLVGSAIRQAETEVARKPPGTI